MKKIAKGFTLVELMIVVAIIGILAAIAIPNFMKYQLRAKYGELPTNINGWFKAEESLRQSERTIPTAVTGGDGSTTGQYFVFAAALPTVAGGACTVAAAPTSKKPWSTVDIGMTAAIDWVVEGSTYGCYMADVAGGTVAQYGTAVLLEAGADIDGDGNEVAVILTKPIIASDGTVTTEVAAAPLSAMAGAAPYSTLQRWDVTNTTNVGSDNVF